MSVYVEIQLWTWKYIRMKFSWHIDHTRRERKVVKFAGAHLAHFALHRMLLIVNYEEIEIYKLKGKKGRQEQARKSRMEQRAKKTHYTLFMEGEGETDS